MNPSSCQRVLLFAKRVDVLLERELTVWFDDLYFLTPEPNYVVERHHEREMPLPMLRGEVTTEVEVPVGATKVPALTRTIFLLNQRDADADGLLHPIELKINCSM